MAHLDRTPNSIPHEEIARLAYQAWEKDGRPAGRDMEYWLQAETQLRLTAVLPGPVPDAESKAFPLQAQLPVTGRAANGKSSPRGARSRKAPPAD